MPLDASDVALLLAAAAWLGYQLSLTGISTYRLWKGEALPEALSKTLSKPSLRE